MAKEELQLIGGKTTIRFEGPNFKPKEIARALNALQSMLERAAQLELRRQPKARLEVLATHLAVGDSWDVSVEYALRVIHLGILTVQVDWSKVAARIARAFRRLGHAHGWPVEVEAGPEVRQGMEVDEREDPRFADCVERLWRATLDSAHEAELELVDGRASIRIGTRRRRKQ